MKFGQACVHKLEPRRKITSGADHIHIINNYTQVLVWWDLIWLVASLLIKKMLPRFSVFARNFMTSSVRRCEPGGIPGIVRHLINYYMN